MYKRFALSGLMACGMLATAHADVQPGFYTGASIGNATFELDDTVGGIRFDESDMSFKIFGGYTFNPYFALEASYFDGGAPELSFGPGAVEVELTGLNASAVGRLPLGDAFALFGKIGYASYDAEITGRVNGFVVESAEASDEDLSYGVGAAFAFGPHFDLRAEYEAIDISNASYSVLSIGGSYRF